MAAEKPIRLNTEDVPLVREHLAGLPLSSMANRIARRPEPVHRAAVRTMGPEAVHSSAHSGSMALDRIADLDLGAPDRIGHPAVSLAEDHKVDRPVTAP